MANMSPALTEGLLLIDKPRGKNSFHLVAVLRKILNVKTIGHAGTLDPFATGVMVLLIGRNFTRLSDSFLKQDKEYEATLKLGVATDSFDCDGQVTHTSDHIPSLSELEEALKAFQGTIQQTPPMFSAKKVGGQKLCNLARQGITVERKSVSCHLVTTLLSYHYPEVKLHIRCSKGTYVRTIAHDLGRALGSFAHLTALTRTRSGTFQLSDCLSYEELTKELVMQNLKGKACF